ncbi:MAG: efflux RND transporter permease subunit [Bacteroidales bacterium]|jgi:HAE1 family hydrophobic/amphiphilic exporter-1|nr:efflux RND transporter permease subunit [Bacteroidales bacterium]
MSIYKTSISKPVTTVLIFVAVIIIGLFSLNRLPIDQFPEIDPPFITVMTTYPGASAGEVETNVTRIIENSLNSIDGLKELTSSSRDNLSIVSLEFEWGTNLDEISNDARSYLDMIRDNLPDGCSTPILFKLNTSMMPILQYYVLAKESYPGLEKILNDEVVTILNRVDGIGTIGIAGAPQRYVYVDIDQAKLDAYGLPLELVGSAIGSNNLNLASGTVKMEKEQYHMQVRSEYIESSEIGDIVVATVMGKPIFVKDVATIRDTIKDLTLDEKVNGQEAVRLMISKKSGANTVQVCKDVRKEMAKIQKRLPSDIEMGIIYDSSEEIQNSIDSLKESILYALLFVVLVVFFFLGKWRATFIIAVTIPISLIVSFIYLLFVGSSLNIISLSSLTVAIGMVVDDAIVVLENITKHIERGSSPREAAIYATNEVWISVIATTLVIVAVFVPLTMLTGMAGVMFKELGWIVTIVISVSTIVAISLTPMLASQMLKANKVRIDEKGHLQIVKPKINWYEKYIEKFHNKVSAWYADILSWCLRHKRVTILIVFIFFGVSLLPALTGRIGADFMPESDNGRISVRVELQRGTRLEETLKTARTLEARFRELVPELKIISTSAGSDEDAGIGALFYSTTNNKISMTVVCNKKYERERTIFEIAEVLRTELDKYPEIIDYQCATTIGMGMGGGNKVDVEVYGYDFDDTNLYAEELLQAIRANIKGARDVNISRDEERPELKITVDKEKIAYHGLNSATVSTYVRNRVNGLLAGYLKEDGDEYEIIVRLKEEDRNSITLIENLTIPTNTGRSIKLKEVAEIEEYWAPPTIDRKSRQRYLTVSITPYNISLGQLAAQVQAEIDKISIPSGLQVRLAGDYEDQQETFVDMFELLLLIVLLVYIVMASQFESLSKPAIIMMSVPFALSGVILALWVTGINLDMIGALGCIMLVGIVVKNGIVLVDYINLMRDRGYKLNEAIALSGESRLRPVLMTAVTTLLGMLPMALSRGEGSELWRPMGIVVIGGLLVSTAITLIIVPVVYAVMSRHGERNKEAKLRKEFVFMQMSADDEAAFKK